MQIFIKPSKFTNQSQAHLSLIISRISFSEELKELSCGLSHLSSQRSSKGVWGRHYPQRRCNCPPNSHCLAGGPGKEAVLRRERFIFQLTKALSWERCSGKCSLKPRRCFFYLFVLGPFFVTTVQIEKARNR